MIAARFICAVLLVTAGGLGVVTRLSREPRSGPGLLGFGFFAGVLATGLWTCLLLIVRFPVNLPSVVLGPLILAALLRPAALRAACWKKPPAAAWLMLPAAAFLVYGALSWDLLGFDAGSFYGFKAKSILHHGTIWNDDFMDPDRIHQAHRRPLLLPSLYADFWLLTGTFEGRWLRLWFVLMQIGAGTALYDVFRARTDRGSSAAGAAFLLCLPALWSDSGGAVTAYADAPFSMIVALALGSGSPLAAFLLAAGAWMKDEGMAFVLSFGLVRGWRPVLIPALMSAGWMSLARLLPADVDYLPHNFLNPHPQSLPFILKSVVKEFFSFKTWSTLWIGVWGMLVWKRRELGREDARWLLPLGLQLGIYMAVWVTMPLNLVEFLVRMEVRRLVMHLAPAAWIWAVCRFGPGERSPDPRPV